MTYNELRSVCAHLADLVESGSLDDADKEVATIRGQVIVDMLKTREQQHANAGLINRKRLAKRYPGDKTIVNWRRWCVSQMVEMPREPTRFAFLSGNWRFDALHVIFYMVVTMFIALVVFIIVTN